MNKQVNKGGQEYDISVPTEQYVLSEQDLAAKQMSERIHQTYQQQENYLDHDM